MNVASGEILIYIILHLFAYKPSYLHLPKKKLEDMGSSYSQEFKQCFSLTCQEPKEMSCNVLARLVVKTELVQQKLKLLVNELLYRIGGSLRSYLVKGFQLINSLLVLAICIALVFTVCLKLVVFLVLNFLLRSAFT